MNTNANKKANISSDRIASSQNASAINANGLGADFISGNDGIARQSTLLEEYVSEKLRIGLQRRLNIKEIFSVTPSEINDLTRSVDNLSLTERQNARNDLYGFQLKDNPSKEDPVQLNIWMKGMDDFIGKGISGGEERFHALRLAMNTNFDSTESSASSSNYRLNNDTTACQYIKSQRLIFLRAEDWIPQNAVDRMALFFKYKLKYFGRHSLTRDLTLADLSEQEREIWKETAFLQLSPGLDVYGRAILLSLTNIQSQYSLAFVSRIFLYFFTAISQDENVQLVGCVQLYFLQNQATSPSRANAFCLLNRALPVRCVSRHLCHDTHELQTVLGAIVKFIKTYSAVRMKLHHGTVMECVYNLLTYGIPRDHIPINNDGEAEVEFHRSFLEAMERKETNDRERRLQERLTMGMIQHQRPNYQMHYNNRNLNGQEMINIDEGKEYQIEPPGPEENWGRIVICLDPLPIQNENPSMLENLMMQSPHPLFSTTSEMPSMNPNTILASQPGSAQTTSAFSYSETTNLISNAASIDVSVPMFNPSIDNSNIRTIDIDTTATASPVLLSPEQSGSESESSNFIVVPGQMDIMMGRGRHNKKRPGNDKLKKLLESYQEMYEAGDRFKKTVLGEVVISTMRKQGSRFLIRDKESTHGLWVEVSRAKARDKVAHDFRNLISLSRLKKKNTDEAVGEVTSGVDASHKQEKNVTQKRQRAT